MAKVTKKHHQSPKNQAKKVRVTRVRRSHLNTGHYDKPLITQKGKSSIYIRLASEGKSKDFATGILCKTGTFDRKTGIIVNDPKATILLRDIEVQLQKVFADFLLTERAIDLKTIWTVAMGGKIPSNIPTFSQLTELLLEQTRKAYEAGEVAKTATQRQGIFNRHILAYVHPKYGENANIKSIVPADARDFVLFCKTKRKLENDYTMSVIKHFKRLLNFAVENEWIVRNPFMNFKRKLDKKFGEVLTVKEVEALQKADIFSPTLDRVRNIFLLQCMTGLSYIDLKNATHNHILTDEVTGKQYLKVYRQKTQNPSIIPLTNEAKGIINKYANDTFCRENGGLLIPVFSNQKLNNFLKELAGVAKIDKRLTTHVGRRTAATHFLNAGVPLSTVSTILGHTNVITTQKHYARLNPDTAIRDVQKALRRRRKKSDENDDEAAMSIAV